MYQAPQELGTTPDAMRIRIKRGTIEHVREGGHVWVVLADDKMDQPVNDMRLLELACSRSRLVSGVQQRFTALYRELGSRVLYRSYPEGWCGRSSNQGDES